MQDQFNKYSNDSNTKLTQQEHNILEKGGIPTSDSEDCPSQLSSSQLTQYNIDSTDQPTNIQQISILEKKIQQLQNEIERQHANHKSQNEEQLKKHQYQVDVLHHQIKLHQNKLEGAESQVMIVKEAMIQVRNVINGTVNESLYIKIKDTPISKQNIKDQILVQVWEFIYPYKVKLEQQDRQIFAQENQIKELTKYKIDSEKEIENLKFQVQNKEESIQQINKNNDHLKKFYEITIHKLKEDLSNLQPAEKQCDLLNSKVSQLEIEKEHYLQQIQQLQKSIYSNINQGDGLANKKMDELRRMYEFTLNDKDYLAKENIELMDKLKRKEEKIDRLEAELQNSKNTQQQYLVQLLDSTSNGTIQFEKKFVDELNQLKDRHKHELEITKQHLIDIYEKQIYFLKDQIDDYEQKLEKITQQQKEREKEYDSMIEDHKNLQRKYEYETTHYRVKNSVIQEEIDRLNAIYEDNATELKRLRSDCENFRTQNHILKQQYYKNEIDYKDHLDAIKQQNLVLKEQITNYQAIEKEINSAVGLDSAPDNELLKTIEQLPPTSKRRIEAAITVCSRLQQKQKETENLLTQNQIKDAQIQQLKDELNIKTAMLDRVSQPNKYYVDNLDDKSQQINQLKDQLKKQKFANERLQSEFNNLKYLYEKSSKDVETLLVKKQKIINIENILMNLVGKDAHKLIEDDIQQAVKEIAQVTGQKDQTIQANKQILAKQNVDNSQNQKTLDNQKGPDWFNKLKKNKK